MAIHCFDRANLRASPWKNGSGVTREIACHPPQAGMQDFDWRISIAHIASDGDFSVFTGVDRVITLLEGDGVHLSSTDGSVLHALDTPLTPFAFPGEAAVQARLLGSGCHDLNVMSRRGVWQAHVSLVTAATLILPADAGMLLTLRGQWQVHAIETDAIGPEAYTLTAQSGLWWTDQSLAWQCHEKQADAALLAVSFTRVLDPADAPLA
jgi:environmental stress-induced protein Ves